jgi:hypothetical protein
MTITAKQLADGQLAAAEGVLYTAASIAYVRSIVLQNRGSGSNACELWLRPSGGSSRRLSYAILSASYTQEWTAPLVLDVSDAIRGAATSANQVDYTIYGAEETS